MHGKESGGRSSATGQDRTGRPVVDSQCSSVSRRQPSCDAGLVVAGHVPRVEW